MVANRKVTGKAKSVPAGLALALGISMGITLFGSLIMAILLDSQTIQESGVGYGIMLLLLLSSAAGAFTAAKSIKRQMLPMSMLSGLCYYAMLLAITALFFGGQYQGMGVTALVVMAGCCVTAIALVKGKGTGTKVHRKRAYR